MRKLAKVPKANLHAALKEHDATLAPMPNPDVITTTAVQPGDFMTSRKAFFKSCISVFDA
jgi:hypothetical protein